MNPTLISALAVAALGSWLAPSSGFAQERQPPILRAGTLPEGLAIDVRSLLDRWQLDSNQLLIKLQYAWRL